MPLRSLLVAALTAAALTATSASALAVPPANDNYLASTALNTQGTALEPILTDTSVNTAEATTQTDLFQPGPNGEVLGGAGPENTQCNGTVFGKTVWWDFHPPVNGDVEIKTSGFDNVITVYQWDDKTSQIVRTVACQHTGGAAEDLSLLKQIKGGRAYTVQVGGVTGPDGQFLGGPLSFELDYFADTDGDGVYDLTPDHCKTTPGPDRFGGCPPPLKAIVTPSLSFANTPSGIRVTRLALTGVPKGAKVQARCGGCPTVTTVAKHATVELKRLVGRNVAKGSKVQLRVTLGRTGKGNFRFGATGVLITWPVKAAGVGNKKTQCLHVGTVKIEKCR
jgi:hypothetical protein